MMTKKLKQDLKKLKGDDLIICSTCGSDNIEEQIYVNPNEYVNLEDGVYYKYKGDAGDMRWCYHCNEPCIATIKGDWEEKNESKI